MKIFHIAIKTGQCKTSKNEYPSRLRYTSRTSFYCRNAFFFVFCFLSQTRSPLNKTRFGRACHRNWCLLWARFCPTRLNGGNPFLAKIRKSLYE